MLERLSERVSDQAVYIIFSSAWTAILAAILLWADVPTIAALPLAVVFNLTGAKISGAF